MEGEEVDENSNFRVQVHTKCESDCIDQRDDDPDFDMAGCSTECELFGLQEPDQVQAIEDEITNKDSKNSKIN